MIVFRSEVPPRTVYTCPTEIAAGILACQKERLFVDAPLVFRLLGHHIYDLFANFSDAEVRDAIHEAEIAKAEYITLCIELSPEAAAKAAK